MEDDHVDRPGVEERQRLKLTGTNSSIGLIVLITHIHQRSRMSGPSGAQGTTKTSEQPREAANRAPYSLLTIGYSLKKLLD